MFKNKKVMVIIIVVVAIGLIYWFFIRKTKEGLTRAMQLKQNAERGKQQEALDAVAKANKLIEEVTACVPAPNEKRAMTAECMAKILELKGYGYNVEKDVDGKIKITKI